MLNPRLAARYAKSLLDLACERNQQEAVCNDMKVLESICNTSSEFVAMLRSPVINSDKKMGAVHAIIDDSMNIITGSFINLLIQKGREQSLPEISTAYISQYNEMNKIKTVKLTTAVAMHPEIKELMVSKIAGFLSEYTIQLDTQVNEDLIGGFVLEVEDKLFDASVRKGLNEVRSNIIDTSYVSKLA